MFAREADHAYSIGPAASRPYLNHAVLERALVETGADAAWVGWGFVAEDPRFAELCERIGVSLRRPVTRGDAAPSATRSGRSCSPSRPACRWRRGATARWTTWRPRSSTRARSATR